MARTNYGFAKRQRDLGKKRKQEEKRRRRAGEPAAETPSNQTAPPTTPEVAEERPAPDPSEEPATD